MRSRSIVIGLSAVLQLTFLADPAHGQEGPATGFSFWVYSGGFSVQELTANSVGVPQFAVGVRKESIRFGVGLGAVRVSTTEKNDFGGGSTSEETISGTLIQIGPEVIVDIWRSPDGRTRGNLGFGASVGTASLTDHYQDQFGTSETKTSGTMAGFHAALGGDYYLSPHFALGAEAGLRGAFAIGLEESGVPGNQLSGGASGTYAALRATFVF
jgi:hypothetical protein